MASKSLRISLANKCQLLFGAAVVLILTAALTVVWSRMHSQVRENLGDFGEKFAKVYSSGVVKLDDELLDPKELDRRATRLGLVLTLVDRDDFPIAAQSDSFLAEAIDVFETRVDRDDHAYYDDEAGVYLFARAIRRSALSRIEGGAMARFDADVDAPLIVDPVEKVLLIRDRTEAAKTQDTINFLFILGAGLLAGLLAIGAFWFITTRIILSPVRLLRETAEKVSEGDLNIRSAIATGDEFERLSDIFNNMLENLKSNQDKLKSTNKSLDLKLGELAEANVSLYEANKIKSEFLANVSHELRTPLNSIVGFAEVLGETLADRTGPIDEKRKRYASNIVSSSRLLLELINDLLDLAKIEAGRMEVRIDPISIEDAAEGLLNLIRPQAEKKNIHLVLKIGRQIPVVKTDAGKLHQVVANFLSNAVKFTPTDGQVTLAAELMPADGQGHEAMVRISVTDTGPGIPPEQHETIFEKFTQLDSTVTRVHAGTGLGLTISRELADLLRGRIELQSREGRGATFSLLIPLELAPASEPLMPDLVRHDLI